MVGVELSLGSWAHSGPALLLGGGDESDLEGQGPDCNYPGSTEGQPQTSLPQCPDPERRGQGESKRTGFGCQLAPGIGAQIWDLSRIFSRIIA